MTSAIDYDVCMREKSIRQDFSDIPKETKHIPDSDCLYKTMNELCIDREFVCASSQKLE